MRIAADAKHQEKEDQLYEQAQGANRLIQQLQQQNLTLQLQHEQATSKLLELQNKEHQYQQELADIQAEVPAQTASFNQQKQILIREKQAIQDEDARRRTILLKKHADERKSLQTHHDVTLREHKRESESREAALTKRISLLQAELDEVRRRQTAPASHSSSSEERTFRTPGVTFSDATFKTPPSTRQVPGGPAATPTTSTGASHQADQTTPFRAGIVPTPRNLYAKQRAQRRDDPTPPGTQPKPPTYPAQPERPPPMTLEAQLWFQACSPFAQATLQTKLRQSFLGSVHDQTRASQDFWFTASQEQQEVMVVLNFPDFSTRPDGMLAALAGFEFEVQPAIVGIPSGIPRDGVHDNPDRFVRVAAPRTHLEEAPLWLGGVCTRCGRLLIDGMCVAMCVTNVPLCTKCDRRGHRYAQCVNASPENPHSPSFGLIAEPGAPHSSTPAYSPFRTPSQTPLVDRGLQESDDDLFNPTRQVPAGAPPQRLPRQRAYQPTPRTTAEQAYLDSIIEGTSHPQPVSQHTRSSLGTSHASSALEDAVRLMAINTRAMQENQATKKKFLSTKGKKLLEKIDMFDGTKPDLYLSWINQVETHAEVLEEEGMTKRDICLDRSKGMALASINAIVPSADWNTFEREMRNGLSDVPNTVVARRVLRMMQQGRQEPLRVYANRYGIYFRAAFNKYASQETDDEKKLDFLQSLLNPRFTENLYRTDKALPRTLQQVFQKVFIEEERFKVLEASRRDPREKTASYQRSVEEIYSPTYEEHEQYPPDTVAAARAIDPRVACYICGANHYQRDCPNSKPKDSAKPQKTAKPPKENPSNGDATRGFPPQQTVNTSITWGNVKTKPATATAKTQTDPPPKKTFQKDGKRAILGRNQPPTPVRSVQTETNHLPEIEEEDLEVPDLPSEMQVDVETSDSE